MNSCQHGLHPDHQHLQGLLEELISQGDILTNLGVAADGLEEPGGHLEDQIHTANPLLPEQSLNQRHPYKYQ